MDGQRFDTLARAVAGGASRRMVIKGFAAGLVAALFGGSRASLVGAQQNVPIGGRCSAFGANSECSQAGTPTGGVAVICSDNGVALDGQFNCCRNAGGVCTADFHCCGSAACQSGLCGGTRTTGAGTTPLGAQCTATSQCSQAGGSVVCSDNGITTDGALNCCRSQGGECIASSNCCSGLACINSVCGGTSGSANLPPGTACNSTAECSQAGGAVVCADNGVATDGALNCCRSGGGPCASSAGCCAGLTCTGGFCSQSGGTTGGTLARGVACTSAGQCDQTGGAVVCADNGYADDGALNCCRNESGACTDTVRSADCCSGLYCRGGVCTDLSVTGQLPPGSACDQADQCDQTGGGVDCAFNGITTGGATNCCRYAGGACTIKAGCCGDADCLNGFCGGGAPAASGLTPGASCTASSQCSQAGGTTICADNGIASDGALNCCRNTGGTCINGAGCCAGMPCTSGICGGGGASGDTGPGGGELPPGSTCTADSQCSQAGGEVVCQDNGIASDGERNCCRYFGACTAANNSAGCCAGYTCVGGTCQAA